MKVPPLQPREITKVFAVLDDTARVFQHCLRWLILLSTVRYLKLQTLAYSPLSLPPRSIVSYGFVDAASLALNQIHLRTLSRAVHNPYLRKLDPRTLLNYLCHWIPLLGLHLVHHHYYGNHPLLLCSTYLPPHPLEHRHFVFPNSHLRSLQDLRLHAIAALHCHGQDAGYFAQKSFPSQIYLHK